MSLAVGWLINALQYSRTSSMSLGCAKVLGGLQIRTTDARTCLDMP
jgi:hypothetical protein